MSKIRIPETEYDKIVDLYKSGLSKEKIEKIYNVSNSVIDRIFRIKNIKCRDNSHKGRKYYINENYFDKIDTPNKAYILGLLYADGCNASNTNLIKLELQERDKSILDKINLELEYSKPLSFHELNRKNSNWQNTYAIEITNKHMSKKLEELGMIPRKSLILEFPDWINDNLMKDFIRGYFDGDGHIEWNKKHFLTLASSKEFCEGLQVYLKDKLNIISTNYLTSNKESNTRVLHIFKSKQIIKVLDWMYKDSILHIDRKYEKYIGILNINNSLSA